MATGCDEGNGSVSSTLLDSIFSLFQGLTTAGKVCRWISAVEQLLVQELRPASGIDGFFLVKVCMQIDKVHQQRVANSRDSP